MLSVYPPIKHYAIHQLAVDSLHTLYIEECGNPRGLPILFIHGGPGIGSDPAHRRFFDPNLYRIILFDQRGCGRSTPHASIQDNTTQLLVSDLEMIRQYLKIERWVLFGGSWGSTLALVYAEKYPEQVLYMVLRGIFLCRREEMDWFYKEGGASRIFPEAWEEFVGHLNITERDEIIASYYRRLTGENEIERMASALAWSKWEAVCSNLLPNPNVLSHLTNPHTALSLARIETHYFMNHIFLAENQILQEAHQLANIPGVIIHGRYDMVCPFDNAYLLHKAWPLSELEIIGDAGHAASEPGITNALIKATNNIAKHYNG